MAIGKADPKANRRKIHLGGGGGQSSIICVRSKILGHTHSIEVQRSFVAVTALWNKETVENMHNGRFLWLSRQLLTVSWHE